MSSFSDALENKTLDHIFGGPDYVRPATLYLALFTVAPDDAGAGGTEATGGAYARKAVTNNATNFPASVAGAKSNGVDLDWIEATASWGTIVYVGIYDAAAAGTFLGGAALAVSKAIAAGDIFRIKAGDLDISLA